jgi:tetratricopeptide (TPR) repeat protein
MRHTKATKSASTASNPPTRTRTLRYLEIAALIVLVPLAIYLWAAPILAERSLAKASLPELVADSQRHPDNPRIFHYLGLRYQQAGDPGQALTAFSKAAQMDTGDEASWLGWAASSSALGKEDDAYHVLTSFLKPHPESAPAHYALAVIYGHRRVHKAAWEEASAATRLNPRNADAWRLAGEEALQYGNLAGAEAGMRRAVALRPTDWLSQMGLGNVLMAQEQGTAAIPCFQEAVRLAPDEATAQLCLGRALLLQAHTPEEIETARQSLQQAIKLQPDLAPAYPLLGQSYSRQGRWTEARSVLLRAWQIAPNNIDIVFALKTAYEHTGERNLAERFTRLHQTLRDVELKKHALISHIAMVPNDIKARLEVARLCAAHGDYTDARNYYRSALARSPDPEPIRRELAAFEESYARNNRSGTVPSGESH